MKKIFSTNYSDNAFNIGILVLRVVAGLTLAINYGYPKLMGFSKLSADFPNPFHLPSSVAAGLLVFAEFFCALLVVLGLTTRLACIPLIIAMGTAFFSAHHAELFSKTGTPSVIYLVIFFCILLVGPGKASADRLIGK